MGLRYKLSLAASRSCQPQARVWAVSEASGGRQPRRGHPVRAASGAGCRNGMGPVETPGPAAGSPAGPGPPPTAAVWFRLPRPLRATRQPPASPMGAPGPILKQRSRRNGTNSPPAVSPPGGPSRSQLQAAWVEQVVLSSPASGETGCCSGRPPAGSALRLGLTEAQQAPDPACCRRRLRGRTAPAFQ